MSEPREHQSLRIASSSLQRYRSYLLEGVRTGLYYTVSSKTVGLSRVTGVPTGAQSGYVVRNGWCFPKTLLNLWLIGFTSNKDLMSDNTKPKLRVLPLGGLGEIGLNMMIISWVKIRFIINTG